MSDGGDFTTVTNSEISSGATTFSMVYSTVFSGSGAEQKRSPTAISTAPSTAPAFSSVNYSH